MVQRKKNPRDPERIRLGERLRTIRESKEITRPAVANALEKSVGAVEHYECGRNEPAMTKIPILAAILGMTAGELCKQLFEDEELVGTGSNPRVARRLTRGWEELTRVDQETIEAMADLLVAYRRRIASEQD